MSQFPLTATDEVVPSDPKSEPTREYYALHPEELGRRILRTRRYFRLIRRKTEMRYAKGLESTLDDFA